MRAPGKLASRGYVRYRCHDCAAMYLGPGDAMRTRGLTKAVLEREGSVQLPDVEVPVPVPSSAAVTDHLGYAPFSSQRDSLDLRIREALGGGGR
jgi:hypothetical protein